MIDEKLFTELYEHGYVDTTISMRMGIPLAKIVKFRFFFFVFLKEEEERY